MVEKIKDKTIFGKATEMRGFLWFYRVENAAKRNAFGCSPKNDVRTKYETFCPDISVFRFIWKGEWYDVDT